MCTALLLASLLGCGETSGQAGFDGGSNTGTSDSGVADAGAADAAMPSCPVDLVCGGQCCSASQSCEIASCAASVDCSLSASCPSGLSCDAQTLHVVDAASAAIARDQLIDYVWKGNGFPSDVLPSAVASVALAESPIALTTPITSIERLTTTMPLTAAEGGGAYTAQAYLMRPQGTATKLIIVHQGHDDWFEEGGLGDAANAFLAEGYAVLLLWMPLYGENSGPAETHNEMMALESPTRSPIQFFVEPIATSLNYAVDAYGLDDIAMVGLSGGGWTTHLYAAIDPTVRLSFPVAGSLPLDMRIGDAVGDGEQEHQALYNAVSYRDLFALAGAGQGRAQVQVLNRDDSCCFSGVRYRGYDNLVASAARNIEGHFRVYLDTTHNQHKISSHVLRDVILSRLSNNLVYIADADLGSNYLGSSFGEFTHSSGWQGHSVGFGGTQHSATAGSGNETTTWRVSDLPPAHYRISTTWRVLANQASNAPFRILLAGEQIAATRVDQRVAPEPGQWHELMDLDVAGQELTIELSDAADGTVVADAIRIERIAAPGLCLD